jgi:uncharacterized protein
MGDYMACNIYNSQVVENAFVIIHIILFQMKKRMIKVHCFLITLKSTRLVLLFVFVNFLLALFFSFLSNYFGGKKISTGFNSFGSISEEILIGIIFGPLIETLIFQLAIIETVRKKLSPFFACLVSALIFGLQHCYNFYYFLFAFFVGIILAYLYYIGGTRLKGFLLVLTAHMLYNSLVFASLHI